MSTFDQVKRQIDLLDPYNLLASHAPQDEYDAESRKISEQISHFDSPAQIAAVIAAVMQDAFGKPESPARFSETALAVRRALAYEYYGHIADLFEYGNESKEACVQTANEIIRQTLTETDPDVLENIFHAVDTLVTYRGCADQLELLPVTENWQRFDAASLEYLPAILAATGDPQYKALIRQIHERDPQIGMPESDADECRKE